MMSETAMEEYTRGQASSICLVGNLMEPLRNRCQGKTQEPGDESGDNLDSNKCRNIANQGRLSD